MKNIYHHTTKNSNGYFDEIPQNDLRSTEDFARLTDKVLKFVERRKKATWRELSNKFTDRYKLGLAVEDLQGKNLLRIDCSRPYELICFGGIETNDDVCLKIGHIISAVKANIDVFCLRCQKAVKK